MPHPSSSRRSFRLASAPRRTDPPTTLHEAMNSITQAMHEHSPTPGTRTNFSLTPRDPLLPSRNTALGLIPCALPGHRRATSATRKRVCSSELLGSSGNDEVRFIEIAVHRDLENAALPHSCQIRPSSGLSNGTGPTRSYATRSPGFGEPCRRDTRSGAVSPICRNRSELARFVVPS